MPCWFLFSVDNNYDQPPNNLLAWWTAKPSLETIAVALDRKFPGATDEETIQIVHIWSGKETQIGNTHYRLESYAEGVL